MSQPNLSQPNAGSTNAGSRAPVRRARHLMDPDNPRPQRRDPMSLSQVQKWVMSILATTTIGHLAAGLVVAAFFVDGSRPGSRVGLLVIAGLFGMVALSVGFLIHRRSPLTPWLLLGWLPSLVGWYLLYLR